LIRLFEAGFIVSIGNIFKFEFDLWYWKLYKLLIGDKDEIPIGDGVADVVINLTLAKSRRSRRFTGFMEKYHY